jgi:hypothetical protein
VKAGFTHPALTIYRGSSYKMTHRSTIICPVTSP